MVRRPSACVAATYPAGLNKRWYLAPIRGGNQTIARRECHAQCESPVSGPDMKVWLPSMDSRHGLRLSDKRNSSRDPYLDLDAKLGAFRLAFLGANQPMLSHMLRTRAKRPQRALKTGFRPGHSGACEARLYQFTGVAFGEGHPPVERVAPVTYMRPSLTC
jgi:hypothetical protein